MWFQASAAARYQPPLIQQGLWQYCRYQQCVHNKSQQEVQQVLLDVGKGNKDMGVGLLRWYLQPCPLGPHPNQPAKGTYVEYDCDFKVVVPQESAIDECLPFTSLREAIACLVKLANLDEKTIEIFCQETEIRDVSNQEEVFDHYAKYYDRDIERTFNTFFLDAQAENRYIPISQSLWHDLDVRENNPYPIFSFQNYWNLLRCLNNSLKPTDQLKLYLLKRLHQAGPLSYIALFEILITSLLGSRGQSLIHKVSHRDSRKIEQVRIKLINPSEMQCHVVLEKNIMNTCSSFIFTLSWIVSVLPHKDLVLKNIELRFQAASHSDKTLPDFSASDESLLRASFEYLAKKIREERNVFPESAMSFATAHRHLPSLNFSNKLATTSALEAPSSN